MAGYTKVNLKDDVEDQAPNFGLEPARSRRGWRACRSSSRTGVSYQRIAPNFRVPFGHTHKARRRSTSSISGSLRAKVDDEIVELDAVRRACASHKDTMRGFEAGPRAPS